MKRKARKPTKQELALAEAERKMLAKHMRPLERGAIANGIKPPPPPPPKARTISESPPITEVHTDLGRWHRKMVGSAAVRESAQYTGSECRGIGTMHKSNSVPVFSDEEAVDIAKMRRN